MTRPNPRIIEKPSLSDWIVFLSDTVNRRQAYLGLIFSSFFSVIVLIFAVATLYTSYTSLAAFFAANNVPFEMGSMNLMIWAVCGSLLFTYVIILSSYLYQVCSKNSSYNRAGALLKKIMKREIITTEDIEKEWFRGIGGVTIIEPKEKKGIITKSDWITYLMGITSTYDNYLIGLAALVITGVFGAIEVNAWLGRPKWEVLIIIFLFIVVYLISMNYIRKIRRQFEDLAEKIMIDDIQDLDEIKKEYKKIKGIIIND